MVYGSYPCSTVSWLQIEPLDLFWVPSIPMIWSFKKVVSSFLCIIILIWRHQGKVNQNAVPAVQRSVPNIIRCPVCHMKALEVFFRLTVLFGFSYNNLGKKYFLLVYTSYCRDGLILKMVLFWSWLYFYISPMLNKVNKMSYFVYRPHLAWPFAIYLKHCILAVHMLLGVL